MPRQTQTGPRGRGHPWRDREQGRGAGGLHRLGQRRLRRLGRLVGVEGILAALLLQSPGEEGAGDQQADHHQGEDGDGERDAPLVGQPWTTHTGLLARGGAHRSAFRSTTWVTIESPTTALVVPAPETTA